MYPPHIRLHPVLLRVDPLGPPQPAAQGLHRYRIRTYAEEVTKIPTWSIRRNYGRVVYGGHVDEEMASKGENRLKSYKTKGLDVEEIRRRKEEEGVQMRRSRREE